MSRHLQRQVRLGGRKPKWVKGWIQTHQTLRDDLQQPNNRLLTSSMTAENPSLPSHHITAFGPSLSTSLSPSSATHRLQVLEQVNSASPGLKGLICTMGTRCLSHRHVVGLGGNDTRSESAVSEVGPWTTEGRSTMTSYFQVPASPLWRARSVSLSRFPRARRDRLRPLAPRAHPATLPPSVDPH